MASTSRANDEPAIGIDLGTTYTCVAVVRNGKVEVIANELGDFTTPSFVAFDKYERMIGKAAKSQLAKNFKNTVFDAKRLIGRKFDDLIVQNDMKRWTFEVVNVKGLPKIQVTYREEVKQYLPEEISAMVLKKMKGIAESYLNTEVKNAVITVPAYFNDLQRKATKNAGTIAGLNVSRIISEPTAAALAYGLTNDTKTAKNVLVYDLGGGTFDVSILNIHTNVYETKATGGDTHLGGEDFDNILMQTFAEEFKQNTTVDISDNKKALRRLRTACERAKKLLSSTTRAPIEIDSLANGIDFQSYLTRLRFDELCGNLFGVTIKIAEETVKDANLKIEDIHSIVLVGGSTRIPKLQHLLQEKFPTAELNKTLNPDEAVAQGAALWADLIHGSASQDMKKLKLIDVTPLTLGVDVVVDGKLKFCPIIERNAPLPASHSSEFHTIEDNQSEIEFEIFQGEHSIPAENLKIGVFEISGIPAALARVEKVTVTFVVDENGILNATAVSNSNGAVKSEVTLENVFGSLTKTQIEKSVNDAEKYREEDKMARKYHAIRWEIEQYCYELKDTVGNYSTVVAKKCREVLDWLKLSGRPDVAEIQQKRDELEAAAAAPKRMKTLKIEKTEDDDVILVSWDGDIISLSDDDD